MTPCEALKSLRKRGFTVRVADDRLIIDGPPAKDGEAAQAWLNANWQELRRVVRIEQHPAVQLVRDVFPGAELVRVDSRRCRDGK